MADRPVLLLAYAGVLGGAERVLLDCATRLGRPAVLGCPDGPLAAEAQRAGLAVERLPARTLRRGAAHAAGLAALARDAQRLVSRHRPAAIVAWGARAVLAGALVPRRGGAPLLAVHHDLLAPPVARAARAAHARAAGVVAASAAVAAAVGRPDATVLHPGVDLDRFTPAPAPGGPPRALVLGALVAWKRADLALEIAARVPELHLELAGTTLPGDDGAFLAGLQRRAVAADLRERVVFLGPVADPRPALARAHVLLHCAGAEPYGLAMVEALAAGRPVVAPAAAGPLEIVVPGTGRLYPPGDAAAGADAVRAVLADPGAPAAARAHAEAELGVDASAARFRAALEAVLR